MVKPKPLTFMKDSLNEASDMDPKIRAVMSNALGDVIKLNMGEETEKLYKRLRETAQSVGGSGHTSGGGAGVGGGGGGGGGGRRRDIYRLAKAFIKVVQKKF